MDTITQLLSDLVAVDTRYVTKSEGNLAKKLLEELSSRGFATETLETDGRLNILADNKLPGKAILFYGHIDTVDVSPGWEHEPFALTMEGDKGYGLGVYDMKGGIAAFLKAVVGTSRHIKIVFAVDEENISTGSWDIVQKRADFFTDVELIISAEPNFGLGLNGITTARTGRVIFTVCSQGKPVHIAKYKEGVNAIYPLVAFVGALRDANLATDKMTIIQPRNIRTNTIGMSLCEKAEVDVEVLLGSDDSIEAMLEKLTSLSRSIGGDLVVTLALRKTPYLTGYRFNSFPYQEKIAKIIQEHTKKQMTLHERSSVGDDNVYATLGIPVITWGPDGGGAHEADEWVDVQSLSTLSAMFKELLIE